MTVTETPPEAATDTSEPLASSAEPAAPPTGLAAVVGSGDHKVIGRLYIGFSLLFGVLALAAGLIVSIDQIDGKFGNTILTSDSWNQVSTFQSTAIVFLFLMPLLLGVALVVVPLQVGADGVAFPRAAAASFWGWLLGSAAFIGAYAINGGPGGGDFDGVGLWAASLVMVVAALLLAAVCLVTTVFALRAEGMTLGRTPLFSWSILVAGVMWVLTLPVLIGTLALIYVDHRYGQKSFGFNGPQMYQRIEWALRQPQVFLLAVPLLGLAADVVPTAAGVRQRQRSVTMGAIGGLGVLGFGAFFQSTIYPKATVELPYIVMACAAILPVLAVLGGLGASLKAGKPKVMAPLVFSLFGVLLLLLAAAGGAAGSIEKFDLRGTIYDLGQPNLVVFAAVLAAIGGVFYWGSKITGKVLPAGLGLLAAVVVALGALLASVPYAISGAFGDGAEARTGIEALNGVAAAGYGLLLLGVVITVLAVLSTLTGSSTAADDPWGSGQTLEWATASPPAFDNFATPPVVRSAEPLLDDDAEEAKA